MADPETQDEPSMEEILASIRRIISEDGEEGEEATAAAPDEPAPEPVAEEPTEQVSEPAAEAAAESVAEPDDILELTEEVDEVDAIFAEENPDPEPEPEPEAEIPAAAMQEEPPAPATPVAPEDPLVSDPALGDAAETLQQLGQMITPPSIDQNQQRVIPGGRTIEDHVLEMLRPMLKEWLDQNLPPLVQRLVQREVDRIVHRSDPL